MLCSLSWLFDRYEDVQEDVEEEVQMLRSEAWHQSVVLFIWYIDIYSCIYKQIMNYLP